MNNILEDLVNGSDLNKIQKNINLGFISRAKENEEQRRETRDLVEKIYGKDNIEEVVLNNEDVIIFKILPKNNDKWSTLYPYRSIYSKNGRWRRSSTVSPTFDIAFLIYLGNKYDGEDSQFSDFAMKMLEIKIEE